jgi:hypothetical protein
MVENEYLKLIATQGRGRAVRIIDKRNEFPGPSEVDFWVREESQQNALSSVHQSDELVTLVLSATDWRGGATWHAWLSLASGVTSVSARLAVFNRRWSPIYCSPHICAWPAASMGFVPVRHSAYRFEIGGAVGLVGTTFGYREWPLAAQSTAYLEALVLPTTLERVDFASEDVAVMLSDDAISIAAAQAGESNRLVVGSSTEPERTFELQLDLAPDQPTVVDLTGLPIKVDRLRLRNRSGRLLLSNASQTDEPVGEHRLGAPRSLDGMLGDDGLLASAERDPGSEHAAAFARGLLKMRAEDWEGALDHLNEATILRGDNPLAWWAKAWCLREMGSDPSQELANAHYLSPLDPVLKGDAFLAAPLDAKPSALLDAWGEDPQPYLEFADLLAHAGQHASRAQWLEEARRRAPCSLIERLLAAAHREHGRELAASEHLLFAESAPERAEAFRRSEIDAEV